MTPTRRTPARTDHVTTLAQQFLDAAATIDLGWSCLLDEIRESGWPARSPEGDRQRPIVEAHAALVADPTGEQAVRLENLHNRVWDLQDFRRIIEDHIRAIKKITDEFLPPVVPSIPCCSVTSCHEPVESRRLTGGNLSFVGCELVGGVWIAKAGVEPKCSRHRKAVERAA